MHIILKYFPPIGDFPHTVWAFSFSARVDGQGSGINMYLSRYRHIYTGLRPTKMINKPLIANLLKGYRDPDWTTYGFPRVYRPPVKVIGKYDRRRTDAIYTSLLESFVRPPDREGGEIVANLQPIYDEVLMSKKCEKRITHGYLNSILANWGYGLS